jgi:hypothetical protein
VVVNDDFDRALTDLHAIVHGRGEASRRGRAGLASFVAGLTAAGQAAKPGGLFGMRTRETTEGYRRVSGIEAISSHN